MATPDGACTASGARDGAAIARVLATRVQAQPRIEISEGERALELWISGGRCVARHRSTCDQAPCGVARDRRRGRSVVATTNPPGSVGEGLALAYRAGATVADLEFVQFHPTALAGSSLLLSEALRGDGAPLLDDEASASSMSWRPGTSSPARSPRGTALLDLRPIDRARFPASWTA